MRFKVRKSEVSVEWKKNTWERSELAEMKHQMSSTSFKGCYFVH